MGPRTVRLMCNIWDDKGVCNSYNLYPLKQDQMQAEEVKGYRIINFADRSKDYQVRLRSNGSATCTCQGYQDWKRCKHISALIAAELLPRDLAMLAHEVTQHGFNAEKTIAQLRDKIGKLEERIVQLTEQPQKSTPKKRAGGRRKKTCEPQPSFSPYSEAGQLVGSAS
jgi:hypothetical protein